MWKPFTSRYGWLGYAIRCHAMHVAAFLASCTSKTHSICVFLVSEAGWFVYNTSTVAFLPHGAMSVWNHKPTTSLFIPGR
jgi:hypothetical protein